MFACQANELMSEIIINCVLLCGAVWAPRNCSVGSQGVCSLLASTKNDSETEFYRNRELESALSKQVSTLTTKGHTQTQNGQLIEHGTHGGAQGINSNARWARDHHSHMRSPPNRQRKSDVETRTCVALRTCAAEATSGLHRTTRGGPFEK